MPRLTLCRFGFATVCVCSLATATSAQEDTAITYQGELKQSGSPATGLFDMEFSKWNALAGGLQVGTTLVLEDVSVSDGRFTVDLDFGGQGYNLDQWLEIQVEGTTLAPRQRIAPAPMAVTLLDMNRDAAGKLVIGSPIPEAQFDVRSDIDDAIAGISTFNTGVIGFTAADQPSAGVLGWSNAVNGTAVLGDATSPNGVNYGVHGRIVSTEQQAAAVYGHAMATTGNTRGGLFQNESNTNGASAIVAHALAQSGFTYGVQASVSSDSGRAVSGFVPNNKSGTAIHGTANNANGYAGYFVGRGYFRDHLHVGASNLGPITNAEYFGVHTPVLGTEFGGMYVSTLGDEGRPFYGYSTDSIVDAYHYFDGGSDQWNLWCGNTRLTVNKSNGAVGIGTTSPAFMLHVNGSAAKPGGGSWSNSSDIRLKKNIEVVYGALDSLLRLRGVTFEYKDPDAINELSGERIGVIAQEVEPVFPDWVDTLESGYKSVTFRGFEALAIEALRDLRAEKDAELDAIRAENERLKERLDQLEEVVSQLLGAAMDEE